MKNLQVEPWISSSSYFFEQENSRCYIVDEKKRKEYMLEGTLADLWYIVLSTQNFSKVEEYSKAHCSYKKLDEFIKELQMVGILKNANVCSSELSDVQVQEKNTSEKAEYDKMRSDKKQWFIENKFLSELIIELSYKCNLNCKHCYNDKSNSRDLINFEEAKKIIDDAIKLGVSNIYFTSGECTIHPEFVKILSYIREKRISFTFVTNGQAIYDDNVLFEKLLLLYPHEIRISLYSMEPEIHDYITGVKGSHEKTVTVIRKLRERNVPVRINYFQMSLNKNSLDGVLKFKNEVGAEMSTDIFFVDNKDNHNSSIKATDEQIYALFKDKNGPYYNLLEYKNPCFGDENFSACKNIKSMISVSPSLDVYPCVVLKYKLANLRELSLVDIWKNQINKFWDVYKVKNLKECKTCEYFEYCIYCPCLAMYENGFLQKSDICCAITKIRMDILREKNKYPPKL